MSALLPSADIKLCEQHVGKGLIATFFGTIIGVLIGSLLFGLYRMLNTARSQSKLIDVRFGS
jgi:hypothetical protein